MKRNEIEVGATYTCKVAGKLTTVRIVKDAGTRMNFASGSHFPAERHGGWEAINTATKRQIHIRSAARLRRKVEVLAFYLDTPSNDPAIDGTRQIPRAEAVVLVSSAFGISGGEWLEALRKMRSAEGLEIKAGVLRARSTETRTT